MKKSNYTLPLLGLLMAFVVLLDSCYPATETLTTSELDIVVTSHEKNEINYQDFTTYAMPDEVLVYGPDDDDSIDPVLETAILTNIEDNLEELGYTRVTDNAVPVDLLIFPELLTVNHTQAGGCYGCWGGWYGGWYPGWGWGGGYYPPYYPPTYVVTYTTGTIAISMIDASTIEDLGPEDNADVIWQGAINGLVRSGITTNYILSLIDQTFDQSPYLDHN